MLWCAPENIKDMKMDRKGSQKGDVYSYGIILSEIAVRGEPYCMCEQDHEGNWSPFIVYIDTIILYYTAVLYSYTTLTVLYSLYYTILYYTILYYTILYYTILYYTILYYTILYYTILYYTILYYTILYYTVYKATFF